jgi:hypothetical protein
VSHKGIRLLIQDVAQSLGDDIQFTYGRVSDFNMMRDKRYPFITLDPLQSTPVYAVDDTTNYSKTWLASMGFYQLDQEASTQDQYAKILDETDEMVDKFINKLNFYSLKSDLIVITSINQTPFIKATADILTGHLLTFSMQVMDDFNYCGYDC